MTAVDLYHAGDAMLDNRGWGRAPQPHAGKDGNDVRITIRKIVEAGQD
jgi:hypothetical protein